MTQANDDATGKRAKTDAGLVAERATSDADTLRETRRAQRLADDLIERDRLRVDARLSNLREGADRMLAEERLVSVARTSAVALERAVADESERTERAVTDALLDNERERADQVINTERRESEVNRLRLEVQRQHTDAQLSSERSGVDDTVHALGETRSALALAQSDFIRRRDVLAIVTHDLRSPLSVIMMNAQSIVETTTDLSTRQAAEDTSRAAARMARLLTDLVDVARIEAGLLRIVKQRNDLSSLLAEVRQSYSPLFAERGMTLSVELPDATIVESFDHDRIVQVLSNLLSNAMKFTPTNGTIELRIERRAGQVEFVLRDSGPGIAPSALPHVFERFWQIDSDARRGLGLGLYICEKIVQAHGGRIWAESKPGKGATFRFTLPTN